MIKPCSHYSPLAHRTSQTDLKIKKSRGMGKLVTNTGYGGKKKIRKKAKDPNEDDAYVPPEKKSAKDEIKSIADWLKKNGEPGKKNIFRAQYERREPDKSRGMVKPTFISVIPKYKY